jgi:hypothetical protein
MHTKYYRVVEHKLNQCLSEDRGQEANDERVVGQVQWSRSVLTVHNTTSMLICRQHGSVTRAATLDFPQCKAVAKIAPIQTGHCSSGRCCHDGAIHGGLEARESSGEGRQHARVRPVCHGGMCSASVRSGRGRGKPRVNLPC